MKNGSQTTITFVTRESQILDFIEDMRKKKKIRSSNLELRKSDLEFINVSTSATKNKDNKFSPKKANRD